MIRIAIVEDEKRESDQLAEYIEQFSEETGEKFSIKCFESGFDFLSDYNADFELVLLDIEMPEIDGMQTAQRLREIDKNVAIIFVTNMAQYAIKGYSVNALDFMLKPISYQNLKLKLQKAIDYVKKNTNFSLVVKTKTEHKRISIKDIRYVEVFGHFLVLHTEREDLQIRGSLSKLEEDARFCCFSRCNDYYLVNMCYVTAFTPTSVSLNGIELPVSRRKKKEFFEKLTNFLGGH